jgi:hypothetical protein
MDVCLRSELTARYLGFEPEHPSFSLQPGAETAFSDLNRSTETHSRFNDLEGRFPQVLSLVRKARTEVVK